MVIVWEDTVDGNTCRFSVTMESQPAEFCNVTLYDPPALYALPFQLYGSCASQIVAFTEAVTDGFTLRFNVTIESQPAAFCKATLYDPAALYELPLQLKGSCASQITTLCVAVNVGFTAKFNVTIESQPAAFCKVTLYDPAALYALPFQLYGSCASQIVEFTEIVTDGFTAKFNVTIESQPAAF